MTVLEEEAVKALTGESNMDINFINSLIPKRRANLEKTLEEEKRIRSEIQQEEESNKVHQQELVEIRPWADAFDSAKLETRRMIIAALIDRIIVESDYSLDIHFRISVEQFLGRAA